MEKEDTDSFQEHLDDPTVRNKLELLTQSSFAVYKNPSNLYQNLVNIISTADKIGWWKIPFFFTLPLTIN